MAEVNAKDLTTKTAPASTDSMLLFGTSTNEGAKITVDNLANNILERLTTKTFANQVGGSSAATILAQLATLNSNLNSEFIRARYGYASGAVVNAKVKFRLPTYHTAFVLMGYNALWYVSVPFNNDVIITNRLIGAADQFVITKDETDYRNVTVETTVEYQDFMVIASEKVEIIST